VDIGLIIVNKL